LTAGRALALFHAGAGARAALRAGTIGVAVVVFAAGSAPDPAYLLMTVVLAAVGPPDAAAWAGGPGVRVALGAGAVGLAALGARRVALGAHAWPASLPVGRAAARRAAWAGAALATLPAALFALAAVALTPTLYGRPLDAARVAALPLLFAAAGAVALRAERSWARALAWLALAGAGIGTWGAALAGVAALASWDRLAGGLARPRPTHTNPLRRVRRAAFGGRARESGARSTGARGTAALASALATVAAWAWRAGGWRAALDAVALAAVPISFCAFVRVNNPDLAPATAAWVGRLGAGLGVALAVAAAAERLLARRAPWAWARALPWSAAHRVGADAAALGLPAFALVGAAALLVLGGAGAALAAVSTALVSAPAAAGALRAGAGRQTGAAGEVVLVGAAWAAAAAARPGLAAAAAPALALALGALAVRRERRAAGAVRWDELRHDPAGDALWLSRV
jgi:hypothetical protein